MAEPRPVTQLEIKYSLTIMRLRQALQFYAEPRNFRVTAGEDRSKDYEELLHRDGFDGEGPGARARAALKE